jgi:two-component system phosphate regulon sensor histidine kinase PhoR
VALPYELAGGGHALYLAVAAALPTGLAAAWGLARRWERRLERLARFAAQLEEGTAMPFLAAERADLLGDVETGLGRMARGVFGTIAALNVERERLEAILRGMVEGVLVIDLAGTVVLMNARARELLGLPIETPWRGRSLVELSRDPGLADVVRELGAGAAVTSRDVTLEASRGLMLQVNAARLRAADDRPFGFVLVLHDVTELRRLEVIRRDFVANVSHELRTPLTAIKGYAETLLGSAGDDRETARRFLAVIDRHSERLGRLIDDLLTLSDLELGRTALRLGTVVVGSVIDDVLQILGAAAHRKGVQIAAEVAPDLPAAHADGDRLRQVLINLVDNGIKYTPPGGRVVVRARGAIGIQAGMVEIAVQDSGVGVPAQDLPRLTERFFRVDKARSRELGGTGLGLAIVKHIVQAHGGFLQIASAMGQGTTVTTYVPQAESRLDAEPRRRLGSGMP